MRAYLPDYQCTKAKSLPHALELIGQGSHPIAGGTDIMVLLDSGNLPPGNYVDILDLKELQGIKIQKNQVLLGALTTYSQIRESKQLAKDFPLLASSAKEVGAIAIQNRGTIGGNIANGSPAADFPPALLVYGAKINLISNTGKRTMDYDNFHLGYKKNHLKKDELIHSITLTPEFKGYHHFWRKVGSRQAQAISKTMVAAVAKTKNKVIEDIRIAFGSVAPTAVRATRVEQFLTGKAINKETIREAKNVLLKDISPIDDIRSTGKYRLVVSQNLMEEFLCGIG